MKTIVCALLLLVVSAQPARAACDQTFSTGNNAAIVSAISAQTGTTFTICLNSGNYGTLTLTDIVRTALVTVQSTTGTGAILSPQISNVDFVRFSSVAPTNVNVTACSTHIEFVNSIWVENTGGGSATGIFFNQGAGCSANQGLLLDGNALVNLDYTFGDERIGTEGAVDGLIIRNNSIGNSGANASNGTSGGIMLGGGVNITIGPGNDFFGMAQSICDADGGQHCDAVQCNGGCDGGTGSPTTIKQNLFRSGDTYIMNPDHSNGLIIQNNVFDECALGYSGPVQNGNNSGTFANLTFDHNTLRCGDAGGASTNSNVTVTNNIFFTRSTMTSTYSVGTCSGTCTRSFNLFNDVTQQIGTNIVSGTPLWTGGADPATWAGWQLTALSPGHNAASDGTDIGTTYYGTATATPVYRLRFR